MCNNYSQIILKAAQALYSTSPHWNMGLSKKSEHFRRWQHFLRYFVTHN